MLSETTLKKECKKYNLDEDGNKIELITRLGRTIKDRERKMLTMGPAHEKLVSHDVTPIHKVDEEDLPKVLNTWYMNNIWEIQKWEILLIFTNYSTQR